MTPGRETVAVRVSRAETVGHTIRVTALGPHGPVTAELTPGPGEPREGFRDRMAAMLRRAVVDQECCARRTAVCVAACEDLTFDLERPAPAEFSVHDGLLEGWVESPTATLLVVLRRGGAEREVVLTPNQYNRFSLDLAGHLLVSITAISPDGLHGPEQVG